MTKDDTENLMKERHLREGENKKGKIQDPDNVSGNLTEELTQKDQKQDQQDQDVTLEDRIRKTLWEKEKLVITLAKFVMGFISVLSLGVMIVLVLSTVKWEWFRILHVEKEVMVALVQSMQYNGIPCLTGLIIEYFFQKRKR